MIKDGVDLRGLKPQMAIAYAIAQAVYYRHSAQPCVITSASDGKHGPNSLHYKGMALDLRTKHVLPAMVPLILRDLAIELSAQFDVVLEDRDGPNQHIHLEFDTKDEPRQDG